GHLLPSREKATPLTSQSGLLPLWDKVPEGRMRGEPPPCSRCPVPQVEAGVGIEEHDLAGVPAEADGVLDLDVDAGRDGGAEQVGADAQGDDLFDAVVLDVVDPRLDRRTGG